MPVNTRELIEAVSIVADNHNIRVTVKSSFRASAIVGATTFVCAMTMGPVGIPIGATAGGLYAYKNAQGTFKSAAVVLRDDLSDRQKERLCEHIIEAFREFRPEDLAMLIPLLMSSGQFQTIALAKVAKFLTDEMQMRIID